MRQASFWKIAAGCAVIVTGASLGLSQVYAAAAAAPSLDYDYFKTKVESVFLTKREGHTRCVVCHTQNNAPFHLVPLPAGSKMWTDEQSRQNFELIKRVAIPGSMDSPLIHHPLAQEAGGDPHHGGGQQFASQQDPAWQTLKAFILGAKAS
jgi:hypothetical protein